MTWTYHTAGRCVLGLSLLAGTAWSASYYVSTTGDDGNDGSGPGGGQALRTVQAGVNRLQPGDALSILTGVYRETVTFPRSGEPGKPISVRPFRDGSVTITGCDVVAGWERHTEGVWKAPMPWTLGLGRNQVFVDGEVMIEARHPNQPDPGLGMYVADLSPDGPTSPEPTEHVGATSSCMRTPSAKSHRQPSGPGT